MKKAGTRKWPEEMEVRKGPWTMDEDLILCTYIANHGEGVWNSVARASGLKRTGKSCRLRWLNYLRPDVRRGNMTAEEELLIIQLHAKLGNRLHFLHVHDPLVYDVENAWSKIAKHLPGRTDNEIKNFRRTKIQKHLKIPENPPTGNSQNSEVNEQASSSQVLGPADAAETFSPAYVEAATFPAPAVMPPAFPIDQSADGEDYWNVEDQWPRHLLNGDHMIKLD